MLATSSFGIGERLVLVHGFTQTRETWGDLVAELKDDYQLLTVDAPNHGGSADIDLDLEHGARAIVDVGG
ncbi:MAG: alpha/beta fold hydrolase, partial [Actinomycetota bacterium]